MRILLADDHALVRDGFASLLEAWGHDIVGQVGDGADAVEAAERLQPDLILMDVQMPRMSGLDATRALGVRHPDLPIVMLTVSEDEHDLFEAIRAGARGYLFKSLDAAQLRAAIESVERGEAAITPAMATRILRLWTERGDEREVGRPWDEAGRPDRLTPRELEVLDLVTGGLRNKEIAAQLGISENTVKYHLKHILDKLHAETRTELAARAVREGLIPS